MASILIGGIAAIGFLFFYEPSETSTADGVTRAYDGLKLVAASLLVGSGGSSMLKSLRDRFEKERVQARNEAAGDIAEGAEPQADGDLTTAMAARGGADRSRSLGGDAIAAAAAHRATLKAISSALGR